MKLYQAIARAWSHESDAEVKENLEIAGDDPTEGFKVLSACEDFISLKISLKFLFGGLECAATITPKLSYGFDIDVTCSNDDVARRAGLEIRKIMERDAFLNLADIPMKKRKK